MGVEAGCPVEGCTGRIAVDIETRAGVGGTQGKTILDVHASRFHSVGDDHTHDYIEGDLDT